MWLFTMALRNLLRNGWRTGISGVAITLAVALVVTGTNFEYGGWQDRLESSITAVSGHVVVLADGYRQDPRPELTVEGSAAAVDRLRQELPEATVLRRAFVGGLMTSPRNSTRAMLSGVDPSAEAAVIKLDEAIVERGEGEWLEDGDTQGVVIGRIVADTLEVGVGDKVVLMTQVGDEMEGVPLRVRGIFETGVELTDGFTAMADISAVQRVLPGSDPAHQLSVQLPMEHMTLAARDATRTALDRDGVEVLTWFEHQPALRRAMELDRGLSAMIYGFIGIIIAVVIVTTMLMSVMQRTREFGVILALGMRPAQLAALILVEALILGLAATGAGLLLQIPGSWYLVNYGVDMGDMVAQGTDTAGVILDPVMRARWDWANIVYYAVMSVILTVLAGVWPAIRATQLMPIESMRHV